MDRTQLNTSELERFSSASIMSDMFSQRRKRLYCSLMTRLNLIFHGVPLTYREIAI